MGHYTESSVPAREDSPKRRREDARMFVEALGERLDELERLAGVARQYQIYSPTEYVYFKYLYEKFTHKTEEFQSLSHIAEAALDVLSRENDNDWIEHKVLDAEFRRLQVPMLKEVIRTNLRLLKIWDDRVRRGAGLPIGAHEAFLDSIKIIHEAKMQLLRPRYESLLDAETMENADRAHRLVRTLVERAPRLFSFSDAHAA